MNPNQIARLAELDARLSAHLVTFRAKEDEDSHVARNAAILGGAGAAGTAAALGGLYARGRLARNGGKWGTTGIRDIDGNFGGLRDIARVAGQDLKYGASTTARGIASAARRAAHSTGVKRYTMLPAVIK